MPGPKLKKIDPKELEKMLHKVQEVDPTVVALTVFRSTGRAVFIGGSDPTGEEGENFHAVEAVQAPMFWPRGNRW